MIEKLTEEQESQLSVFRDKWLEIGLKTGPGNREKAEEALARAYEAAGLKPPKIMLWADSPHAGAILAAALMKIEKAPTPNDLGEVTQKEASDILGSAIYGQHDANWLAFYDYFGRVVGIKEIQKLQGLMDLAEQCGWCWVFDNAAVLTERPTGLSRDERGRLHNPNGPAVAYSDGYGIWAIHGVRVPKDIIENPASLTATRIDAEQNAEVRRVMLERFGLAKYLQETNTKEVQKDRFGKLYRRAQSGDEDLVAVGVVNSTPEPDGTFKEYFLRVPPTTKTAHEAVAFSFRCIPEDYDPEIET